MLTMSGDIENKEGRDAHVIASVQSKEHHCLNDENLFQNDGMNSNPTTLRPATCSLCRKYNSIWAIYILYYSWSMVNKSMRYEDLLESIISHQDYDLVGKFNHYNARCFNNELPPIPIKFAVLKGLAGVCKCKWITNPTMVRPNMSRHQIRQLPGTLVPNTLQIGLDRKYLRTEEEIDAILIHEMIHAWFMVNGDFTENHGSKFLAKLRDCQNKTGLRIPVTEKLENKEVAANIPDKELVVLVEYRSNEVPLYAVINKTAFDKAESAIIEQWIEYSEKYNGRNTTGRQNTLTAYVVKSPLWTAHAFRVPEQRPLSLYGTWVGRSKRGAIKFYYLQSQDLIDDLKANWTPRFSM